MRSVSTANHTAAIRKKIIGARVGSSAPRGQAITAIARAMIACKEWLIRFSRECRFVAIAEMQTPALKRNNSVTTHLKARSLIIYWRSIVSRTRHDRELVAAQGS